MNQKERLSQSAVKQKKKRRIPVLCLIIVAAVVVGAAAFFLSNANRIINKLNLDPIDNTNVYIDPDSLQSLPNVYNILLLGTDQQNDGENPTRSDTMMLLSLDKVNEKIKLTSFMRDIYLYIPGMGKNKMNAACESGGPQLVMDTIEYHFGVDIDAYVMVDFTSFVDIINKLGGVDVEVTAKEAAFIQEIAPHIQEGTNTLNGDEALLYARIRKLDSDFQRTGRQRKVITALIEKSKNASIFKLLDVANQLAPDVKTSLTKSDLSFLARNSVYYLNYEIEELRIPTDTGYQNIELPYPIGQALELNLTDAKTLVQHFIYPTEQESTTASGTK